LCRAANSSYDFEILADSTLVTPVIVQNRTWGTGIYILHHPSREAAAANWKAFQDDPDWKSMKSKSEENGPLTVKVDSTYIAYTDFSKKLG